VDQFVTYQAIAIRSRGIDGQEQSQFVLVDLIDAQDAGKLLHYPSLVVTFEV
jgi:hypothetical protein